MRKGWAWTDGGEREGGVVGAGARPFPLARPRPPLRPPRRINAHTGAAPGRTCVTPHCFGAGVGGERESRSWSQVAHRALRRPSLPTSYSTMQASLSLRSARPAPRARRLSVAARAAAGAINPSVDKASPKVGRHRAGGEMRVVEGRRGAQAAPGAAVRPRAQSRLVLFLLPPRSSPPSLPPTWATSPPSTAAAGGPARSPCATRRTSSTTRRRGTTWGH